MKRNASRSTGRGWAMTATALLLACLWAGSVAAAGQASSSTLVGTVTDSSGAVIPNAQVTVTNAATAAVRTTATDAQGSYTMPLLPVGTYTVTVAAPNFGTVTRTGITTVVDQVARVDAQLKAGDIKETITVTGAAPQLESETSDVGAVITPELVQNAPLNARNFTQLATLIPGVVRSQAGSPLAGGGGLVGGGGMPAVGTEGFRFQTSGGSALSISGLRPGNNNYVLDGLDNNDPVFQQVGIFSPPDSIEEFKIITATPPAEYGRAGGGVIAVVTKSGGNRFHGSAYDYLRNNVLDARNVFNPAQVAGPNNTLVASPKFHLNRNEWGGTIGGPIVKDKTFFFFDYNGFRNVFPATTGPVTVPTLKVRQGDFSEYGVTVCDAQHSNAKTCDPTKPASPGTFLATTGKNQIPTGQMDPAALALLNAFPAPNLPGDSGGIRNNYIADRSRTETQFHTDLRIDHALTSNDALFGRFTFDNLRRRTPSLFAKVPAGFGTGRESSLSRGLALGETHTFSANLLNDFHFGFLRTGVQIHEPGVNGELGIPVNYGQTLGIANSNPAPGAGGLPLIAAGDGLFSDGGFVGDGGTFQVPSDTYQFVDTVSYHRGSHNLKTGVSFVRHDANDSVGNLAKGVYVYAPWGGATTGNSLSDMLQGVNILPEQGWGNFGRGPLLAADETFNEIGTFVQDDFKVSDKLTLNLGVRYDVFTNLKEKNGRLGNFNPATGGITLAGGSLVKTDLNNLGPHIGFAYRLTSATVLRGGYTTMYSVETPGFNGATPNLAFNPPFTGFNSQGKGTADPNGYGVDQKLSQGYPVFASGTDPAKPIGNVIYEDPNKRIPYINSYNLGVEHQMGSFLLSVAGVGNSAHKLGALRPLDTVPYTTANPALTGIQAWEGRGNSSYNSMQVRLEKRMSHGFSLLNSYTWAHVLTDTEGTVSSAGFGGGNYPQDTHKLYLEKGNSENDIRHVMSQAYNWELPFGHNASGAVRQLLGGWTLSGINYFTAGSHLTPSQGGTQRPDLIGDPNSGPKTISDYFNAKAFTKPKGPDGTAGRGILVGPGRWNADFSVLKSIGLSSLHEGARAEFRSNFYNIFNHPQWANPSPSFGGGINAVQSSGFGIIDHAYPQRQIEFALKLFF